MSKREGTMPPNREDIPTPPPRPRDSAVPEPIGASDSRRNRSGAQDGASGRRGRASGPPERSGPIGIASGDFSTPVVRKRTTTQPRLPVVGSGPAKDLLPSTPEAMAARSALVTPPPLNGAPPPPPVTGAELDTPFATSAKADSRDEAALLAAEAAAVRALDSGPITPPPEADDPGPTPPLDPGPTPPPDPARARWFPIPRSGAAGPPTPGLAGLSTPGAVVPATPPPGTVTPPPAAAATPAPIAPLAAVATPAPTFAPTVETISPDAVPTPPPAAVKTPGPTGLQARSGPTALSATPGPTPAPTPAPVASGTPLPSLSAPTPAPLSDEVEAAAVPAQVGAMPAPDAVFEPEAPPSADGTPSPMLEPTLEAAPAAPAAAQDLPGSSDQAGAIPTSTIATDSGVAADGAETKAAPAPGTLPAPASEDESVVAGDDDLEVMEGGDAGLEVAHPVGAALDGVQGAEGASASAPPPPPAAASTRTPPPPIPGRFLKTPAPELRGLEADVPPPTPRAGVPPLPILPEALAQRPRRPKRSKPWFEEVFDEDYLRTLPFMTSEQTLREVEFIEKSLDLPAGAKVLDVGCGYGRHAIELVHRGLNITGLDLSLPLLIRAADEAQRRSLSVNFVHADMREMVFEDQFDGAYSMLTSFGYFDEEANLRVAESIARALRPGGRFLLDVVNRDYIVSDLPSRVWWEGNGCVVLEEVDFNFHTSRVVTHRSIVFDDGRQLEQEISIRAYSLHELGRLLRQAGFRVIDVSGAIATRGHLFGSTSRNLIVLAERRTDES